MIFFYHLFNVHKGDKGDALCIIRNYSSPYGIVRMAYIGAPLEITGAYP